MTSILNPVPGKEEDNGTINRRYFVCLGDENREENSPFNFGVLSASYEIDSIIISEQIIPNNPLCFSRFENK